MGASNMRNLIYTQQNAKKAPQILIISRPAEKMLPLSAFASNMVGWIYKWAEGHH